MKTLIKSRQAVEEELERARTSKVSSNKRQNPTNCEVSSLGLRRQGSVTDNFLLKISATPPQAPACLPAFSPCQSSKIKTDPKGSFLFYAPAAGIEPATNRLTGDCSTAELHRNVLSSCSLGKKKELSRRVSRRPTGRARAIRHQTNMRALSRNSFSFPASILANLLPKEKIR